MPRRRLGVALLIPDPVGTAIDTLRRAVGATDVEALPSHLTLVPPVNVREDELGDAIDRLRDAASSVRPFRITLGPPATFLPINPVLYLQVGGEVGTVDKLRDRIFKPPLERPLTWPFQPHVTVLDGGDEAHIRNAVEALSSWTAEVVLDRVHLLQEYHHDDSGERYWRPIAEERFRGTAVVGRGGLELELSVTEELPEAARQFRDAAFSRHGQERFGDLAGHESLAVTARRDGRIVGTADGEVRATGELYLARLITAPDVRGEGVGAQLVAAFSSEGAARGATHITLTTEAGGPAVPFYERLGFVPVYELPAMRGGRDFVALRKSL